MPADELQEGGGESIAGLREELARERAARLEAEGIAENGFRELYKQQQHLRILESIATAANQGRSVHEVLRFAVNELCRFGAWPVGHVYLTDTLPSLRLRSTPIWHLAHPERTRDFQRISDEFEYQPGGGVLGTVLATGQAMWDIRDHMGEQAQPSSRIKAARACGLHTMIAFPVLVGDEVAAVLEFFSEERQEQDDSVLRLFAQIGTQLGRVVERKRAEDNLLHDALHDPLTGLPNRALFRAQLSQLVARHVRWPGYDFALLFIDLDRFKLINDSLGHAAGDLLLAQVSERILEVLREQDIAVRSVHASGQTALARVGGDEFTVLLEEAALEDAMRLGNHLLEALSPAFTIEGQEIYLTASIGIASSATGYETGDEMLRDADLAMYRAKAQGKARCEAYDRSLHQIAARRLSLETDLRRAVVNREFVLHYQPIMSLADGQLTGFEALVRWQHPDKGLIYPDEFISLAEDTGLIMPLGRWVLAEACHTMRAWQDHYPGRKLTVSVNVSGREFSQPDLVERVAAVLGETGIAADTVRLEITESVTMGDSARAVEVLNRLRELGVRLSIDDFGTGFSSLSHLHRFPFDVLKIDRSFVLKMDQDGDGAQIVRTILALARSMDMEVVAEGTESEPHVAMLKAMGCDYAQGYFYSRPVDALRAASLLKTGAPVAL